MADSEVPLFDKIIALRRKNAAASRKEKPDRPERPPSTKRPEMPPSDHFSRLKISSKPQPKLYNPDRDPIPTIRRTAEPESFLDTASSSHAPKRDPTTRQLFDHRKDDPVRFSVMARPSSSRPTPTPQSSGDQYVSASSTSSYAPSSASTFTLSSTTDGSSTSSALFDNSAAKEQAPTNLITTQLKRLYRDITALEAKVKQQDSEDSLEDSSRSTFKGKGKHANPNQDEDMERDKWKTLIMEHKRLVEFIHNFFEISLAPSAPASLQNLPTKYNILPRLWNWGFLKLLESLRRASFGAGSAIAREHLLDYIIYAYTFYTGLLEEPTLQEFRSGWLEALGDLARFQIAIAAQLSTTSQSDITPIANNLSTLAPPLLSDVNSRSALNSSQSPIPPSLAMDVGMVSSQHPNGHNGSHAPSPPAASVGIAAARLLEVESETEMWRRIARDWYGMGLADQPGTGKLHHHLGFLCRDVVLNEADSSGHAIEALKSVYHFVKSMTTLHPFPLARESILPLWSPQLQLHRQRPEASTAELFILLHGMLFTNIQLDDFNKFLPRLMSRLTDAQSEVLEEREWAMMAVINIASILEYGRSGLTGFKEKERVVMEKVRAGRKVDDNNMDVDGEEAQTNAFPSAPPSLAYLLALKLTFSMFSHVLDHPLRRPSTFSRSSINPYLTIIFTFLSTVLRIPSGPNAVAEKFNIQATGTGVVSPSGRVALERAVPWKAIASFMRCVPRGVMASQGLVVKGVEHRITPEFTMGSWTMLTTGCAPPLPEDWCMRGMEWVGRKVYERGYWKRDTTDKGVEGEYLNEQEGGWGQDDGIVEDDYEDSIKDEKKMAEDKLRRQWVRVVRSAVDIASVVDGFRWIEGSRQWKVEGLLEERVERWAEEDRLEREADEMWRKRVRQDDAMDVDENEMVLQEDNSEEDDEDEMDSGEVKDLKARRRYLQSLLSSSRQSLSTVTLSSESRRSNKVRHSHPALPILPGYTVLVVDTNILLSSLKIFASLVESVRWTLVVPLPVVMELDGLATSKSPLGDAAKQAVDRISQWVKTHSMTLKVQTSRGNYMSGLNIRQEDIDFRGRHSDGTEERNMDDLILRTAICHEEQWIDRSAMLKVDDREMLNRTSGEPIKVVLLSLDRNLRLKARSRGFPAASEKDLASLLSVSS